MPIAEQMGNNNLLPSTMSPFHVYLLHEHRRGSYTCLESYPIKEFKPLDEKPIKHLEKTALEHMEQHGKFQGMKLLGAAKFEIYRVRWLGGAQIAQNLISCFAVFKAAPDGVATGEGEPCG